MNKRVIAILFLVPLLVLGIALIINGTLSPEELVLTPSNESVSLWPWAENSGKDSSKIISFVEDRKGVSCTYILNAKAPYAGFTITPKNAPHWDVEKYDYLEICFDPQRSSSIQVGLSYFLEGYSVLNKWQTLRLTDKIFHSITEKKYRIPFKELTTPIWWFRENNIQEKDIPQISYKTLANIAFVSGENQELGKEQSVVITSIRFVKERAISQSLLWMLFGGYAGILILLFVFKRSTLPLPFIKMIPVSNHADEEYQRISEYMGKHYQEKELSQSKVAEMTGIPSSKIGQHLQTFRSQSYSQFLNSIRLTEAKRLLRETDRNVSEISSIVGYGYVNSFNRVFKDMEGKTPLEYRTMSN